MPAPTTDPSDAPSASSSSEPLFTPVDISERIASLDVLRGVAVLGILLMNIVAFGLPLVAYNNPTGAGGAEGANLVSWGVANMFFEGTFRTIFSILFGAGVVLFMTRAEGKCNSVRAADFYYRRTIWLIVFGVVHAYLLLWIGEILYAYGVTALLLFVFRNVGPRKLLICGLLVLAALVPKRVYHAHHLTEARDHYTEATIALALGKPLTPARADAIAGWREIEFLYQPTEHDISQEIALHQAGYLTNLVGLAQINSVVQGQWYYDWNFWDILGVMLIGMALIKMNILSAQRSLLFYMTMVALGYSIGLTVNAWETQQLVQSQFDLAVMGQTQYTYDLGRLAMSAGHIGMVMLLCRLQWFARLRASLAAVGRMALTNYITHTVICVTLFSGFGFGLYGQLERYQLYYVVAAIWLLQLMVSPIWLTYFRFGPLEWLWRTLTYWKIQPLLRPGASPDLVPPPESIQEA